LELVSVMATGGYHGGGQYTVSTDDAATLTLLRSLPDGSCSAFALALNGGVDDGHGSRDANATWFSVDAATYRLCMKMAGLPDDLTQRDPKRSWS
jgi:hypothetical protein